MHASRLPRLLPFALAFLLSPPAFAADTPAAELLRQAEAERPAYLDTLRQLVAVDSGTGQAEGLGQLSALLAERLQALGAQVRSAPATPSAGDNLVATLDGTGSKRFLLMIHYDTVFAAGSAAKRPFREDAERAYGPGVADAKGGVAMVLHALALLRQQGFRDYGRITVLFNPDEETGSAGSKQLIAELARQQDYVFSYEPPDRDAVTVATNGIDGLLLEVKGRSSHAGSAPEQGRNAILELSHQLLRLKALGDPAKGTTLNWTLARGGEKRNIIPAEASAEADMRYSDPAESERVLADARKLTGERLIADTEVSLRLDKGRPPLVKNPASQRLAETAQTLYGRIGKRIEPIAMRFGTDAGYAYVPGSDKPAVLETLGVVGAGLHSEAEYLELSSIAPRLYLTVALIRELSAD
ncbi:M20/M25/M40 family metallo-hydrolase [Pseudomonas aeruginosa]|nr:M20/M25/M40 family metallo-hydrolase [Pseudomonas aeruginosa]